MVDRSGVRKRRRLAARALSRGSIERRSGDGPRTVALHTASELLRRFHGVVGSLSHRGCDRCAVVDGHRARGDVDTIVARVRRDAAREGTETTPSRLRSVYPADGGVLSETAAGGFALTPYQVG